MQSRIWRSWCIAVAASVAAGCGSQVSEPNRTLGDMGTTSSALELVPATFSWQTVVNNATAIPGADKNFSSYNQPSVNGSGLVVFRARSTGSEGGESSGTGPVRGIFTRDMRDRLAPGDVTLLFRNRGGKGVESDVYNTVPQPNNLDAPFNEFPSIPRIDIGSATIATRGQSRPVWEFAIGYDDATDPPTELTTRVGTSGVYATPGGVPTTGASLLGAVADWQPPYTLAFPQYQVPGALAGIRFDQFPGAPGLAGPKTIVFKGNWTDENKVGRTGVYFRDVSSSENLTYRIADSYATLIPGTTTLFGSTAPPSGALLRDGTPYMVFVGFDIEEAPTMGGVYLAKLAPGSTVTTLAKPAPGPTLTTLAKVGDTVLDFDGKTKLGKFKVFGEGLSFDGRFVAFWGAWGSETRTITLTCPVDGNAAVIKYCVDNSPGETGVYTKEVPLHQGLFVADIANIQKPKVVMLARTGGASGIEDFLFWNYSGRPPETGSSEEGGEDTLEPPRWRSNAFAAVNRPQANKVRLAFKALKTDGSSGIYLVMGPSTKEILPRTVMDTRTLATTVDPAAVAIGEDNVPVDVPLYVTTVGIERDAFRSSGTEDGGSFLVLNASMADESATYAWGGIYLTRLPNDD